MSEAALKKLEEIESDHPGLSDYVAAVQAFLQDPPLDVFRERFAVAISRVGEDTIRKACRQWEKEGILPDVTALTQEQVGALWENVIFTLLLGDCVEFYPPEHVNLADEKPVPCKQLRDLQVREAPDLSSAPYWKKVLYLNFPEFYLEPLLRAPNGRNIVGCDLACGWGRASLTLPDYTNRNIVCCDLAERNLDLLEKLARRAKLAEHVTTKRCDITSLPFPDESFDFFLAFDIFEHLNDHALEQTAHEILRCAKAGAVLYTETPLQAYCLAVTHVQDFTYHSLTSFFRNCSAHGKQFRLGMYIEFIPDQFGFVIGAS